MIIHDTCLCGNDLWHWSVKDREITLNCPKCGAEASMMLGIAPELLRTIVKKNTKSLDEELAEYFKTAGRN